MTKKTTWLILILIWLVSASCDRLWFALDNSVPSWDQAEYLNGALTYYQALQNPHWLDSDWWRSFWLLSNKTPPLTYILTVPWLNLFGTGNDAATLVMLPFSAIIIISVYYLGVILFNPTIGLWGAAISQLLPGLYRYRLDFLLDYPLTSIVTLCFCCLTIWRKEKNWLWSICLGISLGLAFLVKQTALFFLFLPLIWTFIVTIRNKKYQQIAQLILGLSLSICIFYPWYRTNWLLILTSGKRATIDSALIEGDPNLNTIHAWTYYLKVLPYLLSWTLLITPIVILIIYRLVKHWQKKKNLNNNSINTARWLSIFLIGGYFLSSLNINKDHRYILPLLPVLSLVLAWGLLSVKGRIGRYIPGITLALAVIVMLLNIFPLGGQAVTKILSPKMEKYPYLRQPWPHQAVIEEINQTSPYLRSTLGVLPSTPTINQHNLSVYGKQSNFPVYGRQVGVRKEEIKQDKRSLDWFLTKTGDQGSVPQAQADIVRLVEKSADFQLQKSWQLPDKSSLNLYHRRQPSIEVTAKSRSQYLKPIYLDTVIVPSVSPPGVPIPVTYQWSGESQKLADGIVLLTWKNDQEFWIHDHGIGLGNIHLGKYQQPGESLTVRENLAMISPSDISPGEYYLSATYLNRETGESFPLNTGKVSIKIDAKAQANSSPELDLSTQLRNIAPNLALGLEGLDPIFSQTARINQYDPVQDYLKQTELALSYRLQNNITQAKHQDWAYAIALARVLQQDVTGSLEAIKQVIQLDRDNPYPYAYLAFIYLYDWRGKAAEKAIAPAIKINPDVPEFIGLRGIGALMQGNLIQAWRDIKDLIP